MEKDPEEVGQLGGHYGFGSTQRRLLLPDREPISVSAWKEVAALKQLFDLPEEYGFYKIQVDQCQFGLVGPGGGASIEREHGF